MKQLRSNKRNFPALSVIAALALLMALAVPLFNGGPDKVVVALAQELDEGGDREGLEENVGDSDLGGDGVTQGGGGGGVGEVDLGSGGNDNLTFGLRLASAEIESLDLDDDDLEFVRFNFVEPIDDIEDDQGFMLRGLDSDELLEAETAFRDEDDLSSVVAGFEENSDLPSFALAVIDMDAVHNVSGEGNVPDAVLLGGSTISIQDGRTDGPDLLDVNINPSLERAEFIFDENLDEDMSPSAGNLGYYALDGEIHSGQRVVSIEDEVVTVVFDEDDGDQVEEAVTFFVLGDTVEDLHGNENAIGAVGGQTTGPDLVGVEEALGDTQWDYVFDEDVTDAEPDLFLVYTADGTSYEAESVSRPDANTVRAAFPELFEFGQEILLAAVEPGAVQADKGFDTPNTAGAQAVSSGDLGDGPTTGPDLESIDIEAGPGQIAFTFDEMVDDDEVWDPDDFFAISASGALVPAEHFVETDGEQVIMTYDPTLLQAARGVAINGDAVRDFQGNPNPMESMEYSGGPTAGGSVNSPTGGTLDLEPIGQENQSGATAASETSETFVVDDESAESSPGGAPESGETDSESDADGASEAGTSETFVVDDESTEPSEDGTPGAV